MEEAKQALSACKGTRKRFSGSKKGKFVDDGLDPTRFVKEQCALCVSINAELLRAKAMGLCIPGSHYRQNHPFFFLRVLDCILCNVRVLMVLVQAFERVCKVT